MKARRRRLIALVVVAAMIAGVAAVLLSSGRVSEAERDAITAYAAKVKELSFEGGRLLQEEIKPRVTDLREGTVTPDQFRREAGNWILLYQNLRRDFAGTRHPARLDDTARRYDEALATYIEAFEAFRDASRLATAEARNDAITDAVPIAERADKMFDAARDELERQMRAAGLTPPDL